MTKHSQNDNRICIIKIWCRENPQISQEKKKKKKAPCSGYVKILAKYSLKQELWFFGELKIIKVSKKCPGRTEEFEGKIISYYFGLKGILPLPLVKGFWQIILICISGWSVTLWDKFIRCLKSTGNYVFENNLCCLP